LSEEDAEQTMERNGDHKSVSQPKHSVVIRVDLCDAELSQMICKTLSVDKEPARSTATRLLSTEDNFLVAQISSTDRKYLQKSVDNFFDMCDLAKQTYDVIGRYQLNNKDEAVSKKRMKTTVKN
uniref:L antigen family member 3 n=1 Tax=Anisakis simplex TaxID=6269 RepID=A0A0M3J701_ANISI